MKKMHLMKIKECESCKGTGMLMWKGEGAPCLIKVCSMCSSTKKAFTSQYGTRAGDAPRYYVNLEERALVKVDRKKDYILLPSGIIINNPKI